jgi:hypothetical protein
VKVFRRVTCVVAVSIGFPLCIASWLLAVASVATGMASEFCADVAGIDLSDDDDKPDPPRRECPSHG